jgi:pimeloyl-ACP methyl ester carboxylesterase
MFNGLQETSENSEKIMQKDIIHFSHANGFPSLSYRVMLDALSKTYDVRWIDQLAHHPDFPVTNNWPYLADELIDYFEKNYDCPVIAVGHSLGGVISFMVAKQRPDLIKQVILLDSPIADVIGSIALKIAKKIGAMDRITPAGRTEGRQETWDSYDQAIEYFRGKSLFKRVDNRCLQDYVTHGTAPWNNGIKLTFNADTEISIYRTLPDNLQQGKKRLTVPSALIYGANSKVVGSSRLSYMKNKVGVYIDEMEGGHLFPLEYPEATAKKIEQTIVYLSNEK